MNVPRLEYPTGGDVKTAVVETAPKIAICDLVRNDVEAILDKIDGGR